MRRWLLVSGCVGALAAPAAAEAAGGPVVAVQGGPGVAVRAAAARYVAVGAGHETIVEQVLRGERGIGRTRALDGVWGVPGVTYDRRHHRPVGRRAHARPRRDPDALSHPPHPPRGPRRAEAAG